MPSLKFKIADEDLEVVDDGFFDAVPPVQDDAQPAHAEALIDEPEIASPFGRQGLGEPQPTLAGERASDANTRRWIVRSAPIAAFVLFVVAFASTQLGPTRAERRGADAGDVAGAAQPRSASPLRQRAPRLARRAAPELPARRAARKRRRPSRPAPSSVPAPPPAPASAPSASSEQREFTFER